MASLIPIPGASHERVELGRVEEDCTDIEGGKLGCHGRDGENHSRVGELDEVSQLGLSR